MLGFSQAESEDARTAPFACDEACYLRRTAGRRPVPAGGLYHRIWKGSLPRICLGKDRFWHQAYASYVDTYLMRDIMASRAVRDEGRFRRFLGACAAMTGQPLNHALLAETADVDAKTASAWFSLLESSYAVRRIEALSSNLVPRLTRLPAVHFFDTGLACYLARWTSADALSDGALNGHVLETFSYLEIEKSWAASYAKPEVSFLRTERGKEIDLVISDAGAAHPVKVKHTASPGASDLKNFSVLDRVSPGSHGCVLCLADRALPITERFWGFPVWVI